MPDAEEESALIQVNHIIWQKRKIYRAIVQMILIFSRKLWDINVTRTLIVVHIFE